MMLHIREGKGRKGKSTPLSIHVSCGLQTYIGSKHTYVLLFNGKDTTAELQQFSSTGVQWVIEETTKRAGNVLPATSRRGIKRNTFSNSPQGAGNMTHEIPRLSGSLPDRPAGVQLNIFTDLINISAFFC